MEWFRKRFSARSEDVPEPDEAYLDLLADHALIAFDRQQLFEAWSGDRDWILDQDQGLLLLGDDLVLPAQILGSVSDRSRTWLWAWANPSVETSLTKHARRAQEIGTERSIEVLTDPQVNLGSIPDVPLLVLAVTGALGADAYYPCPYPGGAAYLTVEVPDEVKHDTRPSVERATTTISRAIIGAPVLVSRRSIERYLAHLGVAIEDGSSGDHIGLEQGTTFRFDDNGRLTAMEATLGA